MWAAGSAHTLKSLGVEGICIDALFVLAPRDPPATDCSNSFPADGLFGGKPGVSDWLLKLRKGSFEAQRVGEFGTFASAPRIGSIIIGAPENL